MTTTTHRPAVRLTDRATAEDLAADLVRFLETGLASERLFAEDVFVDFTPPMWRVQARGRQDAVESRVRSHPMTGRVPRTRLDLTEGGFLLEVEEEWDVEDQQWYCRELIRCDVGPDGISEISVYCTGDWDPATIARHAAAVELLRP